MLDPGGLFVIECFIQDVTDFEHSQRVATRALAEDSVEMEFLRHDPVAQTVTERYGGFDRSPFTGMSRSHVSVYELAFGPTNMSISS